MKINLSSQDAKLLAEAKEKERIRKENELKRSENDKQREQLKSDPLPIPSDRYRTIVIDPPWPLTKIKRETRPNQVEFDYPTMTVNEIKQLQIPIADDGFVFLWTTQKFLPSSFDILAAWGLTYRFAMVWHKNGGIQPYNSAQLNCEFVVVGSKGNPKFTDLKAFNTAFYGKRREHSVKPSEFYNIIRRVTSKPRLDMFNRQKIDGFDVWGNESENNNQQQTLDI